MITSGHCLQVDELSVVHLQQHTSDLSSKLRVDGLNLGEDHLTQDLLLLSGLGTGNLGLERGAAVALGASGLVGTVVVIVVVVTAIATTSALAVVGRISRHATRTSVRGRHTAATLRSTTSTHGSLLSLHSSHELRSAGLAVLRRELSGHAVHVGGHLLGNTTATTLLRVAGELAGSTALDTAHANTGLREGHTTTALGHEAGLLSVENGGLHVLLGHTGGGGSLLHAQLVASLNAGFELALADILALSKSNVQGLAVDHTLVHLGDSLGGIVGVAEADETEALALTNLLIALLVSLLIGVLLLGLLGLLFLRLSLLLLVFLLILAVIRSLTGSVSHDLGRGNGTELGEHLAKLFIINIVIKVLDVEVDTLVLVGLLKTGSLVRLAQLLLTLVLLLGTANVQVLALEVLAVEFLDSLGGALVSSVVDKTETTALALLITGKRSRRDLAVLLEEITEFVVRSLNGDVLDINVGEVGLHLFKLALAVLLGDVVADIDLLLIEKHAIDVLDSLLSSLIRLVVDKTIALGGAGLILGNLAGQNVAKGGKGIVKSLVVNGHIKVLDEDVALTSLAEGRVTLGPHDAARATLDESVVELLESLLAIRGGVVVDVGIAERATGDGITADTDGSDSADLGEEFEEHGLGDGGVELSNVERSGVLGVRSSRVGGRTRGILRASTNRGVDGGLGITAAVERGVVEVVGKLVNSAGGSVGGHFDVEEVENRWI